MVYMCLLKIYIYQHEKKKLFTVFECKLIGRTVANIKLHMHSNEGYLGFCALLTNLF